MKNKTSIRQQSGIILISTLMMLSMMLTLVAAYFLTTKTEIGTSRYSGDSVNGFYTAEAGLNIRADQIRQAFIDFSIPVGTAPSSTNPCTGTNLGTGAFVCQEYTFGMHKTKTYIMPDAGNPITVTIPSGDRFQGLTAQEYRYTAKATASNVATGKVESMVDLVFKVRTVPIFQFAAFYNKDLEVTPGAAMTFIGPIHANGDIYLNSQDSSSTKLQIDGQITMSGNLYRGRKDTNECNSSAVKVKDPASYRQLTSSCPSRTRVYPADVTAFNKMIQIGIPAVGVPPVSSIEPVAGKAFWDRADLRLMMKLTNAEAIDTSVSSTGIYVANANGTVNTAATTSLHSASCTSSVSGFTKPVKMSTFKNYRENANILVLDMDMTGMFNCLKNTNWFSTSKLLSETSDGGLVFFLGVVGPNSNTMNRYGVRVRNGAELKATVSGAPAIKGLTIITNQALYTLGDYNSVNKKPAALISDSYNVLSNQWLDSENNFSDRVPSAGVVVNAAIVSNTDTTGGVEGAGGQGGAYGGGIHNFPRMHEDWNGKTVTLLGSMVSLNKPLRVDGPWAQNSPYYTIPARAFSYDTSFNSPSNLPPMTMQFVYLREELFLRDFEQ